jgi:hypothetical protein
MGCVFSALLGHRPTACNAALYCAGMWKILLDVCELDDMFSSYVDVYDSTADEWIRHPQGLGLARSNLAAASLSSGLAFFAGGSTGNTLSFIYGLLPSCLRRFVIFVVLLI